MNDEKNGRERMERKTNTGGEWSEIRKNEGDTKETGTGKRSKGRRQNKNEVSEG